MRPSPTALGLDIWFPIYANVRLPEEANVGLGSRVLFGGHFGVLVPIDGGELGWSGATKHLSSVVESLESGLDVFIA